MVENQWISWEEGTVISVNESDMIFSDGKSGFPALVIDADKKFLAYALFRSGKPIPGENSKCKHGKNNSRNIRKICLQLEKNFSLYLVNNDASFPVADLGSQPYGFPIKYRQAKYLWTTIKN